MNKISNLILSAALVCITSSAFATSPVSPTINLTGCSYSRLVDSDGLFGQPTGARKHTMKFLDSQNLVDNSSTFFGNPPEVGTYTISQGYPVHILSVTTVSRNTGHTYKSVFALSLNLQTITNEVGAVLILEGCRP